MASCPAPLCITFAEYPRLPASSSNRPRISWLISTGGTVSLSLMETVTPCFFSMFFMKEPNVSTTRSSFSISAERTSMVKNTFPGTMFDPPGYTSIRPIVPTVPSPASRAARSRKRAASDAARRALHRMSMGVVPAWSARPMISTSLWVMPTMVLTKPRSRPSLSRTGPCSIWSSMKALRLPFGRTASPILSGSRPDSFMARAMEMPSLSRKMSSDSRLRSPAMALLP